MGRRSDDDKDRDPLETVEDHGRAPIGFLEVELSRRDSEVFRRNLRLLWHESGLTGKQLLKRALIEGSDDWFRQYASSGLSRVTPKAEVRLKKLAKFFNLHSYDDFWNPDLVAVIVGRSGSIKTDSTVAAHAVLSGQVYPRVEKFAELIKSGEYPFLEQLVDTLYTLHQKHGREREDEEWKRQSVKPKDETQMRVESVTSQFDKRDSKSPKTIADIIKRKKGEDDKV